MLNPRDFVLCCLVLTPRLSIIYLLISKIRLFKKATLHKKRAKKLEFTSRKKKIKKKLQERRELMNRGRESLDASPQTRDQSNR